MVMLSGDGLIVIDRTVAVDTDALSETRTVKLFDPGVSGVPDIVPPAARINPEGSDPADITHE